MDIHTVYALRIVILSSNQFILELNPGLAFAFVPTGNRRKQPRCTYGVNVALYYIRYIVMKIVLYLNFKCVRLQDQENLLLKEIPLTQVTERLIENIRRE
jgi:hypothetical protein